MDPKIAPALPGAGAAHFDPTNGTSATTSAPPHASENHPILTKLARILGSQFAREATRKGGSDG